MPTMTRFDVLMHDLAQAKHNLATDALKFALSNTAPVAGNTVFANLVEIAAGNGYVAGGFALPGRALTQVTSQSRLSGADTAAVLAASGGSIGPFQYVVLYNDTAVGKPLIGWVDIGAPVTITDGTSRDLNLTSAADAILTLG